MSDGRTGQAPTRWGMSGPARAAAYTLAFASGLRRNEIRTLTTASFNLGTDPPTVTVRAGYSKHRRTDVQPLPADVAEMLAGYLADADPDRPFLLPDKSGVMLHEDMADARAAWIADAPTEGEGQARQGDPAFLLPRDAEGLVLDLHSFRHGYVTAICRAEVSPRVMMALTRHSDPRLTMRRYSRAAIGRHRQGPGRPAQAGRRAGRPIPGRALAGDGNGRRQVRPGHARLPHGGRSWARAAGFRAVCAKRPRRKTPGCPPITVPSALPFPLPNLADLGRLRWTWIDARQYVPTVEISLKHVGKLLFSRRNRHRRA
jgi:hypothetical protein